MNQAIIFIQAIGQELTEMNPLLQDILYVLEDGDAMERMGVTDDDQELVEEAHSWVQSWIDEGKQYLGQCQF